MKAILWDMDGTLVDTEPRWGEATYAMCAEMGRELTPEVRETTVGGIAENTVRICADWAGLTLDEKSLSRWVDRLYAIVSGLFSADLPFRPGIPELLTEGTGMLPMMVVTNTYRSLTDQALQTIGADHFVGSVCGDEVDHGKPPPGAVPPGLPVSGPGPGRMPGRGGLDQRDALGGGGRMPRPRRPVPGQRRTRRRSGHRRPASGTGERSARPDNRGPAGHVGSHHRVHG